MWETLEELLSKSLNEICLFYIPFRGNGCGKDRKSLRDVLRISKREVTLSQEFIAREATSPSPMHFGKSYICVWHITVAGYTLLIKANARTMTWIQEKSWQSENTHTQTYTNKITFNFEFSDCRGCSSLSLMATPHLEIVSWERSLEQGDYSTLMTWWKQWMDENQGTSFYAGLGVGMISMQLTRHYTTKDANSEEPTGALWRHLCSLQKMI